MHIQLFNFHSPLKVKACLQLPFACMPRCLHAQHRGLGPSLATCKAWVVAGASEPASRFFASCLRCNATCKRAALIRTHARTHAATI